MTETTPDGSPRWRPHHNPWLVAVVATVAAFMEVLDSTIVNVSLPHIAGSLSAGTDEATWTLTSYLVANGIVLPLSGWLSSVFGRRNFFLICIAFFTLFSLLCGLATSLPALIGFRLLQGLFGGGLQPTQQAILLDSFPPEKRGMVFAVTAIAVVVGPVLGPTLGGYLTDAFSWRWIFFVNVPVGIGAWLGCAWLVEDPPHAKRGKQTGGIDGIGIGLIAIGFGALQIMLDKGTTEDWFDSRLICVCAFASAAALCAAVFWLLGRSNPVVDIRLFANRNFAIGNALIFMTGAVLYSSAVLLPQFAQLDLGYTSLLAGLVLSPGALATIALLPLVARLLLPRVPTKWLIAFGFAILGLALVWTGTRISGQVAFGELVIARISQTLGLAFLFVPISIVTFSGLSAAQNSSGAALYAMSRNVGGSIGIALATALVANRSQWRFAQLAPYQSPFSQAYNDALSNTTQGLVNLGAAVSSAGSQANGYLYQTLIQQSSILAYADAFIVVGCASLAAVTLALILRSAPAPTRMPLGGH